MIPSESSQAIYRSKRTNLAAGYGQASTGSTGIPWVYDRGGRGDQDA